MMMMMVMIMLMMVMLSIMINSIVMCRPVHSRRVVAMTWPYKFSSKWYTCTRKSPYNYALHPVSQRFPQRCL